MPQQTVSDELKATVLADLATGEQPAVVAQRYGLGRDLVKQWRQRMNVQAPAASGDTEVTPTPVPDVRRVHPDSTLGRLQATQAATQAALDRNTTVAAGIERTIGELDAWLDAVTIDTPVAIFAEKRAKRELLASVLKRTRADRTALEKRQQAARAEHSRISEAWHKYCAEYEALSDLTNPYTQALTLGFLQTRPKEIEQWLRAMAWEPAQADQEVTS